MTIQNMFPGYIIENNQYELKQRLNKDDQISWLKTVAGFANAKGGTLFVGVKDSNGELCGYDYKEIDKERIFFYNSVRDKMPLAPDIVFEPLPYFDESNKQKYILKITIMESKKKPIFLKIDGYPVVFIRRDGFTNGASIEEIQYMFNNNNQAKYDEQITDIDFDINDFASLNKFYKDINKEDLSEKKLEAVGMFDKNKKLTRGGYLFSNNCNEKNTSIVCTIYQGVTRGKNEFVSSEKYIGNIVDGYNYINNFIKRNMRIHYKKNNTGRTEIYPFPERAVFEAIINALAHRDYLLDGTQISVELFDDRLSITSPGALYNSTELNLTRDLSSIISRRRNEIVCNIFVYAKAMEAKGTGFEKILESYKKYDDKYQPFIFSKNNQFTIVLPDLTNPDGINISNESLIVGKIINNQSKHDISILKACYFSKKSAREISDIINVSDSTYFRSQILDNLVSQGFLNVVDEEKTKYYQTNKNFIKLR